MNLWLWADLALVLGVVPCALVVLRPAEFSHRPVGVHIAGLILALGVLILAQSLEHPSFSDLAVALSLLAFPTGFMFAFFIERWWG